MTSDDIKRGGVIPSPNSTKNTKGSKSVSIEKKIMHSYSVSGNDCEFSVTFFHPSKKKKTKIFHLLIFAFNFLYIY